MVAQRHLSIQFNLQEDGAEILDGAAILRPLVILRRLSTTNYRRQTVAQNKDQCRSVRPETQMPIAYVIDTGEFLAQNQDQKRSSTVANDNGAYLA
jgi:hypothetical protein